MKKSILTIFLLIFILIISSNTLAVVITPIGKELTYEPNKEKIKQESCGFNIKGSDDDSKITFKVTGDLNSSVKLENEYLNTEKDTWYSVNCIINLNDSIKPGPHYINIISVESPKNAGQLSAVAGVLFPIKIFVPYPGKYIEIRNFVAKDIEINQTQNFNLKIISRGSEKLNIVTAKITIINPEGFVSSINSDPISLETGEEAEINIPWDSLGNQAGQYTAEAIVNYDGKEEKIQTLFKIGDIRIDVQNILHDKIKKNSIAKFDVQLQSYWNKEIPDTYLILTIYDKTNKEIATVKGENFPILPWNTMTKQVFWDTKSAPKGAYKANVTVIHSTGRSSEKQIEFQIYENYPIMTIALIIIIILLLVLLYSNIKRIKKDETNK